MSSLKRFFSVLFLLTSFAAAANTVSQREVDLHESLLDMAARFDSGVNYVDFKRNLSELNVKFDRYTRSGGDRYGYLYDAMKAYRDAAISWDESINAKSERGSEVMLDLAMKQAQYARRALDKYKIEQIEQAKKLSAKAKKPSALKNNESSMEKLEKELKAIDDKGKADREALDQKFRQEQRNIDRGRACKYSNPPSC